MNNPPFLAKYSSFLVTLTLLCFQSELLSPSWSLAKLSPRTGLLFTALKGVTYVIRVTELHVMSRDHCEVVTCLDLELVSVLRR